MPVLLTIEGQDVAASIDVRSDIRGALQNVGRTEDVRFAPSSDRLILAGFARNVIAALDVEITSPASMRLTGFEELSSARIDGPHGVEFLDDETIVVANRGGDLDVLRLASAAPRDAPALRGVQLESWLGHRIEPLTEPSLVRIARAGVDVDVVIGSNGGEHITVHRVAVHESEPPEIHAGVDELGGIAEPDGAAISSDRRWLAVSAHGMRAVFVYDRSSPRSPERSPVAILRGPVFPHGVCFTPDDELLLAADAGRPFAHVFRRGAAWSGVRHADLAVRVMDDATYERGHGNPQEGGPKGIDIDPSGRVLVTTCRCAPLAAFDIAAIRDCLPEATPDETADVAAELLLMRDMWRDLHATRVALSSVRRSRVLRATAPLRDRYRRWSGRG